MGGLPRQRHGTVDSLLHRGENKGEFKKASSRLPPGVGVAKNEVAQAFQPASPGDFPVASIGKESPVLGHETGMSRQPTDKNVCATPKHGLLADRQRCILRLWIPAASSRPRAGLWPVCIRGASFRI